VSATNSENSAPSEPPPDFRSELGEFWRALPDKPVFLALLGAWVLLFHFLGNSTFGYLDTASLFGWLEYAYSNEPDDAHGRLIPFVVLALYWVKRKELIAVSKHPWWPALLLVAAGLSLHIVGYLVQQARVSVIAFFIGLYGLTGAVWGWAWLRSTFFPFFLFAFCFPLGTLAEQITFPMRIWVSQISVGIGHLLGIEVLRVGTQLIGADGFNYDVAPACSGIRSLTALLALTTIYGFLTFRAPWKRALMMALAIPLALLGNVARVTGVIIVAQVYGEDAGTRFHDGAGFVTFAVALVCIFAIAHFIRERDPAVTPQQA
jgi:exosortase